MKRDHIDFTKTKACCLCGGGKNLSKAEIGRFGLYTACEVLMCPECAKLCGAKKRKDGTLFVKDVDAVPGKVAKMSAEFAEAMKKALAAEMGKRAADLAPWIAEPFKLVGGETFGQVAMKEWTDAKDEAFAEKLEVVEYFKSKSPWTMRCPVCGKPLVLDAPDPEKMEINDALKFKCPDGCLAFDETELAELYGESYANYVRRLAAGHGTWGWEPSKVRREKETIGARSCTAYALDQLEKVLGKLAGEMHEAIYDAGSYGEKCRHCKKNRSYDVCGKCYVEFDAAHPEIRKRAVDGVYGFKKGMNLRGLLEAVERSNKYRASEHCKLWCETSPDNMARGVCGATSRPCGKYDGCESCRKCADHVEGKPLGNFLATAAMCQHYSDGKCLKCRGKDGKWKGREDLDACTYRADHYVYSDRGRFCESFKLRDGLDLDTALTASRAGKSYSGFYR